MDENKMIRIGFVLWGLIFGIAVLILCGGGLVVLRVLGML